MIDHVFIDMDGVLVDFISAAFQAHKSTYDPLTYPKMEWSIASVLGVTENEFWDKIDRATGFWENLQQYPWAIRLVEAAKALAPIKLLSTPSSHPSCHFGKRMWCLEHLPGVEMILCKSKYLLAQPGRVLIDDREDTIRKWEEAGGIGILFPQPWNSNYSVADLGIDYVLATIENLKTSTRLNGA
jgi:5'(3')-deoxyribonucleotidase